MKEKSPLDLLAEQQDARLASPSYGSHPGAFNPWTATEVEAMQHASASGTSSADHANPVLAWHRAQRVLGMREAIERGDGVAVLDAVAECFLCDLQPPAWLALAFLSRWRSVKHASVGSWDEAFGQPWPKGTQLARKRLVQENAVRAWLAAVRRIRADPGRPITKALWQEIGTELGFSATTAEELARSHSSLLTLAEIKAQHNNDREKPLLDDGLRALDAAFHSSHGGKPAKS